MLVVVFRIEGLGDFCVCDVLKSGVAFECVSIMIKFVPFLDSIFEQSYLSRL